MQPLCIGASYVPCIVAETGNIATTGQVPPYSHRAYISIGITNYKVRYFQIVITAVKEQGGLLDWRMTYGEMGKGGTYSPHFLPSSIHAATF